MGRLELRRRRDRLTAAKRRMMKFWNFATILSIAVFFAACSVSGTAEPVPDIATTRVVLQQAGAEPLSVYAFRQQNEYFLFDAFYRDGWTDDGRMTVRMANGNYKFLFAGGESQQIALVQQLIAGQTAWEDALFGLRENPDLPGTCFPADELFLQYPASEANAIHAVKGGDMTVSAKLERAVCAIRLFVKRGYRIGAEYAEVPYPAPQSVLDEIERFDLTIENTGLRVNSDGSSGSAAVVKSLTAANCTILSNNGFAEYAGPFIIPPADGGEVDVRIDVTPAANSALQSAQLHVTGRAERNKRLDITLWITSGYPLIGIDIRTAPIEQEHEGDTGIWE